MTPIISEEYFRNIADDLIEAVTHPEFLRRVVALREAPWEKKEEYIEKVDLEDMRAADVPIAGHIRVSPRTFERPEFATINGVQEMGRIPGSDADGTIEEAFDTGAWGAEAAEFPMLMDSVETIRATMEIGFEQLIAFVMTPEFQLALSDMITLPEETRPAFVLETFLDPAERLVRGIEPPPSMRFQRSTFRDGRPTLFCIAMLLPLAYPWRKLTVTIDNDLVAAANPTEPHLVTAG